MKGSMVQLAFSDDFFDQLGKLTANTRKKLQAFLSKVREHPSLNGLNIEKLNAKASMYYSARVDDNFRVIFVKISSNNDDGNCIYTFLHVAAHDDAYDWANRHTCEFNPITHSIQLYETLSVKNNDDELSQGKANKIEPEVQALSPNETEKTVKLFDGVTNDDLLSLGVPKNILSVVSRLQNKHELEAISKNLPADVYESLMWLADGDSIDDIKAAYADGDKSIGSDPVSAFKSKRSRRSFKVIESDDVIKNIINAGTEKWRIFLHPMQEDLVKNNLDGARPLAPMLVRGAAGTGKTVVALHRAAQLVKSSHWPKDEKLLFVTYTKNLSIDIESMLKKLCDPDEMQRIEVKNFDSWLVSFLKQNDVKKEIVYASKPIYESCWEEAKELIPYKLDLSDSFYEEEWERIILPNEITDEKEYLRVKRLGRGTSLSRNQRKEIWPVFETMRTSMIAKGIMTYEDACFTAIHILEHNPGLSHYHAVVVDEAQDLGNEAFKLLALLCRNAQSGEPFIFLAGDGRQRIYKRVGSLRSCGINISGRRSTRLRVSYRTTDEIRKVANAVLLQCSFNDMDEGAELLKGESSLRHGNKPEIYNGKGFDDECDWIVSQIKDLLNSDNSSTRLSERDICLVCRTNPLVEKYKQGLEARGFKCSLLARKKSDNGNVDELRVATMHRVKGLEFPVVFICGANDRVIPWQSRSKDKEELNSQNLTERSLFYVAASRARDNLFVSSSDEPGEFIKLLSKLG